MRARTLIPAALVAGGVVLGMTAVAAMVIHQPLEVFTRDVTEIEPYVGAVSILNGMVWAAGAALALLAAYLVPEKRRWLLLFGVLLLVFAADDALRLHEGVGPFLGVSELAFFAVYGVIGLVLLRGVLARPFDGRTVPFLIGGALLAVSVLVDQVVGGLFFAEDGAKLLGALVWLTLPPLSLPTSLREHSAAR